MIPSRSTATMASGRVSRRSFERRTSAIVVAERERAGCLRVEEGRGIQFRFEPSVLNLCRSRLVCKGVKRGYAVRALRRDRDLEPRTNIRIPAMLPSFLLQAPSLLPRFANALRGREHQSNRIQVFRLHLSWGNTHVRDIFELLQQIYQRHGINQSG